MPTNPWSFLLVGYVLTVMVELPVLMALLSARHGVGVRVTAGLWLTACTYPVVVLVLPPLFRSADGWDYLLVAETFAPAAECTLFLAAFGTATWKRDCAVVTLANLLSFGLGELLWRALK